MNDHWAIDENGTVYHAADTPEHFTGEYWLPRENIPTDLDFFTFLLHISAKSWATDECIGNLVRVARRAYRLNSNEHAAPEKIDHAGRAA